jgi:hypothetical protein
VVTDYDRWRGAEAEGRDEEADRLFRSVFQANLSEEPIVSAAFVARTLDAVAATTLRDARRTRRTRVALAAAAVAGLVAFLYYGTGWAVSMVTGLFIGAVNLFVGAVVRGAGGVEASAGLWGVVGSLGRAAAAFIADPKVTVTIFAVQAFAMAALLALQRLLGSDVESLE